MDNNNIGQGKKIRGGKEYFLSERHQAPNHVGSKKYVKVALASIARLVGASPHTPKGRGFHFQSRYIPRLQVLSPVVTLIGDNQSVFLSHIDVSVSPPFLSL